MEKLLEKYKYDYEDIKYSLVVAKGPEICAAYPEHITVHFENVANVDDNYDSVLPYEKNRPRG